MFWNKRYWLLPLLLGCVEIEELPIADPITVTPPTAEEQRTYWVTHWARVFEVDTTLALQVSRAENWTAVRNAWSSTLCCVGDMQVNVGVWYGWFDEECGGSDLLTHRDNTCYGVLILRHYLWRTGGNVEEALRLYLGASTMTKARGYIDDVMGD